MRKLNLCHIFLTAVVAVTLVGCSDRVAVTGTVTYLDGSPLQVGQVVFTDDKFAYRGPIDRNGFYRLGGTRIGDGIVRGNYQVYLIDVETTESDETGERTWFVRHAAQKFMAPETSGITCEVNGRMVFDFQVERP